MKAELKKKWVEALRSRKFKQGQAALKETISGEKDKYTYCCLGVLHEVSGGKWHQFYNYPTYFTGVKHTSNASNVFLDGKCFSQGLTRDEQNKLAEMNDDGKKFYQIANWIEKNIKTKN